MSAEDDLFEAEQAFRRETIDTVRLIRLRIEQHAEENRALANRIESAFSAIRELREEVASALASGGTLG